MTLTRSELELLGAAADLLDDVLIAAHIELTPTQKAHALSELEARLARLRARWRAEAFAEWDRVD